MAESEHRLPRTVLPRRYGLAIDTDLDAETFTGQVEIDADVAAATSSIVMSADSLVITSVSVGRGGAELDTEWHLVPEQERLVIDVGDGVDPGPITIRIDFAGRLDPQLEGFYPSTYVDDGDNHTLGVTQFEAPFARKAFPCFDEPDFKAVFEISLVCDADHLAISNSAQSAVSELGGGRKRVDFAPTIPMSTYLVAWVIGRLDVSDAVSVGDVDIRVVARPGQAHLRDFALDCAAHALGWFEQYYGLAYPGDKIDLVAIPDFAFGAMENLGCVTFRETLLLIDPATASRAELERAATVIEHELAHMWFGDLVTMSWWNGIWLNEAFATFMEMAAADDFRPEWDIWTSFGSSKTQAYDTDALFATRPIEYPVLTPRDAEGMFDILTYEKGASILRMFEQWMGPDAFRSGVRDYLAAHAYANTETGDLWAALSGATDSDLTDAMESWIFTGGHPLVSVEATDDGVTIAQEPFTYLDAAPGSSGGTDNRRWSVPVRMRALVDGEIVDAGGLLEDTGLDIALGNRPEWVIANVDASGFYRTRVPASLRADPIDMNAAERLDAIDSLAALVIARRAEPSELIALATSFAPLVSEPAVWRRISDVVAWLSRVGGPDARADIERFVGRLVGDRLAGLDPAVVVGGDAGETRAVITRLAGLHGADATVIDMSRRIVSHPDPGGLDPELTAAAPDIVAAHGDASDVERLTEMYRDAPTPQHELRALGALARFPSEQLVEDFCRFCLDEVRTQNAPYALAAAMANPVGGASAWRFVADNWEAVNERFPSGSIIRMVGGTRALGDVTAIGEALSFFDDHDVPQARTTLTQHLENLHVNLVTIEVYRPVIVDALRS